MLYDRAEQNIADQLRQQIGNELSRIGLLFRVFSRAKTMDSIESKLIRKSYGPLPGDKKMQDLFGVRVALYFSDDSDLAQRALKAMFTWDRDSSTIDKPTDATFGPTRCNLIFRLPEELSSLSAILRSDQRVDSAFEVQFRTVFSEGWHEVEHDLRYKCKEDWRMHPDLDRAMNGFVATLETCDWAMVKLFEDLAWRHYKAQEWLPMIRTRFRLRLSEESLDESIVKILDSDNDVAKKLFRVSRSGLLAKIFESKIDLPVTPSNLVYIANHIFIRSQALTDIAPSPVRTELVDMIKV